LRRWAAVCNVTGRSGITLHADTSLAAVEASKPSHEFDWIFLPGGPGVKILRADPRVVALVRPSTRRWTLARRHLRRSDGIARRGPARRPTLHGAFFGGWRVEKYSVRRARGSR